MKNPWEFDDRLSQSRIISISQILKDARDSARDTLDAADGDSGWSVGCVAYDRSRNRISMTAEAGIFDWLNVRDPGLQFVFDIQGVPCRLVRDDPDDPSAKVRRVAGTEQFSFGFIKEFDALPSIWRFIVESDVDGYTRRISLQGMNAQFRVLARYDIDAADLVSSDNVSHEDGARWFNADDSSVDSDSTLPRRRDDKEEKEKG